MTDAPQPYSGPHVILELDRVGFRVSIHAAAQLDPSRTFHSKDDAWAYARGLWTLLRLPLHDLTEPNAARSRLGSPS